MPHPFFNATPTQADWLHILLTTGLALAVIGICVLGALAVYAWLDVQGQASTQAEGMVLGKQVDPHHLAMAGDLIMAGTGYVLRVGHADGQEDCVVDEHTYAQASEGMPVQLTVRRGRWSGKVMIDQVQLR